MRDPSVLTFIAEVDPTEYGILKAHLKGNVNPDAQGPNAQKTPKELNFENYPNLHFLSFCMPEPQGDMPCQLVMEATFDGPEDAFIRDLVHGDLNALIRIFRHCPDFPRRARENPHLVEIYLKQHTLPSQTFFSGAPGKTVAEIKRERRLRNKLGEILRAAPKSIQAAEPRRLQDHLRREALKDDDLSLMSQPSAPPSSLTNGDRMVRLLSYFLLLPVLLIGALIFRCDAIGAGWEWLTKHDFEGGVLRLGLASLIFLGVMRVQDWVVRASKRVNPEAKPFVIGGVAGAASLITKVLMSIVAVQLLFLMAKGVESVLWPSQHWPALHLSVVIIAVVVALILFFFAYLFALYVGWIRASAGRLQQADRRQSEAQPKWFKPWQAFVVFWAAFALAWLPVATILIAVPGPATLGNTAHIWSYVVLLSGWFAAGLALVIAIWVLALYAHDCLQERENQKFINPEKLHDRQLNYPERWAQEEHGYMRRQNHYISLTTVKNSWWRRWLVTLALTVVNFIARYQDNKGTLGGIPTIFSARWALIDNGRRLLFMTNYSGAWDSYLNEFSELASVTGVNLIWTNTYIAPSDQAHRKGIHFPPTKLFTGKGARATLPFKAFVRQSQLETLVWYGAYRDLSVVNVSDNAKIREAVFGPPGAAALDLLLKRL